MKKIGITIFVLGLIMNGSMADNLAHEKLSDLEKKAKNQINKFLESCTLYPTFKVRIEVSKDNLTDTDLANEAKKKAKANFNPAPKLTDKELFPASGDPDLDKTYFTSNNYSKERNTWCEKQTGSLNKNFRVIGATAESKGKKLLSYVLQNRFGDTKHTTLFYLISLPFYDYENLPLAVEIGKDEDKPGIDSYEVRHEVHTFKTDGDLQNFFDLNNIKQVDENHRRQLAIARSLVIKHGGPYGKAILDGEYSKDVNTKWELKKLVHEKMDKRLDAVHFNEKDNGSYTVFFEPESDNVAYIYFES